MTASATTQIGRHVKQVLPLHLTRKDDGVDVSLHDVASQILQWTDVVGQPPFIHAQFVQRGASQPKRVGQRSAALAVVNDRHFRVSEIDARHRLEQLVARVWRRRGYVRAQTVAFQRGGRLRPAAHDRSALQGFDNERELILAFGLLQQRGRAGAGEKDMHTAGRCLEPGYRNRRRCRRSRWALRERRALTARRRRSVEPALRARCPCEPRGAPRERREVHHALAETRHYRRQSDVLVEPARAAACSRMSVAAIHIDNYAHKSPRSTRRDPRRTRTRCNSQKTNRHNSRRLTARMNISV